MSSQKSIKLERCDETTGEDRISELHPDLKHLILKDLTVKEIARTSVLSTQWRHIFRNHPYLIFDHTAYYYSRNNQYMNNRTVDEFLKTIKRILSTHTGLLDQFVLYVVHKQKSTNTLSLVDQVMSIVPTTITKLRVNIQFNERYAVTITQFPELTYLEIYCCSLKYHPTTTFLKLTRLHLYALSVPHNLFQPLSRIAPNLERLSFWCCDWPDGDTVTIDAPRLKEFVMNNCRLRHCSFSETTSLSSVTLHLKHQLNNNSDGFCHVLPKLTSLEILNMTSTIGVLAPCLKPIEFSECKPWALKKLNLRGLRLTQASTFMPELILLLKRAKNLEELWIEDYSTESDELHHDNFDKFIFKDVTLDRLGRLSLVLLGESHHGLQLLRSIRPCLPVLMNLNIGYSTTTLDSTEQERVVVDCVSEFCSASPNVKLTYFRI
ncbi:uncharacterized protein LOC141655881 [Silene latifolia]|uniref:uncharacterized protein LOC141655881 n=1 Tax=Silene latifolia TaxID=37657 RepID=UPI003D778C4F